jgi:hypothetical protein
MHGYVVRLVICGLGASLAGCGGGGGGNGGGGGGSGWTQGVFMPSQSFAAECVAPRSGVNPATGQSYPDLQGTTLDENNFLRSWSDETYLWYDEIVDQDPAGFNNPLVYFDELRTFDVTPSGADKDKFHFIYSTDEWFQLSQSGESVGYGAAWIILASAPPREAVVGPVRSMPVCSRRPRESRILSSWRISVRTATPARLR